MAVQRAPRAEPASVPPGPIAPAAAPASADGSRAARRRRLPHPPRRALVLLALVLLVALGFAGVQAWRSMQPVGPLVGSGTVEADEVLVGAEVAGRLVSLDAEEGKRVRAGDVLARLDDTLIQRQLQQADVAQRRQLEVQAERYQITAPSAGTVTRVPLHVGEVVQPGQTIAAIADLARLKLTIYVLERDLGRVQVGQTARVTVDPFPDQAFQAVVTSISQQAEFTPRNVQTQRDRLNLVFGVKLRVANPEGLLKPGMPADATFE